MNILLWAPFGAGTHYWGPGTSAYRLYKNNKDYNVKVTLVHGAEEQELFPDVYYEQIKLPSFRNGSYIDMLKYYISANKWIKQNYKKYDVIHGISAFEYTFRPLYLFSKLGKPVFIKITGEHGGFGNNSWLSKILGIASRRIKYANLLTGYISISSKITLNLIQHGINKNKIHQIPNGVDIERFSIINNFEKEKLRTKLNIENKFTFIYVGGLTLNKRIIEIVNAIIKLKEKYQNRFQFLIVGPDRSNGVVENEINNLITLYGLESSIKRIPHIENPEIFFQISDVFMLMSQTEGLSNSLLEAMSTGLATIVTKISGSEDLVIENKSGYFCDGSVYDIYNKMSFYIENRQLCFEHGLKSRKIIEKNYSDKIIFTKHIEIFKKYGRNI